MATHPLPVAPVSAQIPHISRILVPVDFSEISLATVHRALHLAGIFHASIVLAHVMTRNPVRNLKGLIPDDTPTPELELQENLELLRHLALDRSIPCTAIFRTGSIVENVLDLIQRESIDLVVLATHGGRSKYGIFLGSTAEQLIRSISVPVLTICSSQRQSNWDDKSPRHILFAANFAKNGITGLPFALGLREITDAQVSVAEVVPPGIWPDIHSIIRERVSSTVPPGTDIHLPIGPVGSTIAELATDIAADLIVLCVHRDTLLREVFGSNLLHIILNAPCPVLTLRQSGTGS